MRVGIIGCGKIADQHADEIRRIPDCSIAGVCDQEELMAHQLAERFLAEAAYSDVAQMLTRARLDVVHITTPPQSHFPLAQLCIEAGCSVYVEKPFTVTLDEAETLIGLAERANVKITVGHNAQFTRVARRMRQLVADGYLGGPPLHVESHYGYDLGDPAYAKALFGDANHWVKALPGKLLQNVISHGLCKIVEFLPDDDPTVLAEAFASPTLRAIEASGIKDELRVVIKARNNFTGYFTFSSQLRPSAHYMRIFGSKNALLADEDHETLVKIPGKKYKSYLDQFVPPIVLAGDYLSNAVGNVVAFLKRDLHMNAGMRYLIRSFYRAISDGGPVPIPYREIRVTSRTMEAIFKQIGETAGTGEGS